MICETQLTRAVASATPTCTLCCGPLIVAQTDWHSGDWPLDNKLPLVGGHEGAGHIVALNPHTETDLKIGDAVGLKCPGRFLVLTR